MKNKIILLILLTLPVFIEGCGLVKGIFKAGVWVGVIIVVVILIIVGIIMSVLRK